MNIDTIKKYKNEFDHFVNGGKLLWARARDYKLSWLKATGNHQEFFNTNDEYYIYIIDDEYVEFRKALAEGKTVQCNAREGQNDITYTAFGHNWWVDTTEFKYATSFYRIKPEEPKIPKFKVGDWVNVPAIDSVPCQFSEDLCCLGLALWKPKIGERCWFSDNLYEEPILSILTDIRYINQQKDTVHNYYTEYSDCNGKNFYKICQPFICVLPIGMKK